MNTGLTIRFRSMLVVATLSAAMLIPISTTKACHGCLPAPTTLTEQLALADSALLVKWISGEKERVVASKDLEGGTETISGSSTYQIVRVMKGPKSPAPDQKIRLNYYSARKIGDLFVLMGRNSDDGQGFDWSSPIEVTEAGFNYLSGAPSTEVPARQRLAYFFDFLDAPDPTISNDAFGEFSNAQYEDIELVVAQLSKEKLRNWITNPDTPAIRLGLYGLLLGLCGTSEDAKLLEERVLLQTDEFRLGIDGLIGGYLLLTRDRGLDLVDKHKLLNKDAPFSETFAAMQAVRFMWSHGNGKFAPERLRQSMRILLDRHDLTDLVIADLARWKDWSIQDQLMTMYGQGKYNTPAIKRAIMRYMLASSKDMASGADAAHRVRGLKILDELRIKDPKTAFEVERFFVVP